VIMEVTEWCISYVKECLPQVHIVKGRPRHPQSQGCVERGNATFKDALNSWMADNPSNGWGTEGAIIVNAQLNKWPSRQKANKSPYQIYYGKLGAPNSNNLLGTDIMNSTRTEYSITALYALMDHMSKNHPEAMI
jgi:hypothetical protein